MSMFGGDVVPRTTSRLRETGMRLRMLNRSLSAALDFAFIGDSWTDSDVRYVRMVTEYLTATYGDGGPGWIGFGFSTNITGNSRDNLYTTTKSGTWAANYGTGATDSPNISNATSSTASSKFTVVSTGTAVLTTMTLFWEGTADGVVRYRWDGGGWTSLNVQGSGIQTADLGSLPVGATWTLEIEVVSGSVKLCGLNGKKATGVRVHKLSCSGIKASGWLLCDATQWQTGIAALGLNAACLMFGVNEKAQDIVPGVFGTAMGGLLDRVAAAVPSADLCVIMPCETATTETYTMAQYAAVARAVAESKDAEWLNLQDAFGDSVADYEWGSVRSWLAADDEHPVNATTAPVIPNAIIRMVEAK